MAFQTQQTQTVLPTPAGLHPGDEISAPQLMDELLQQQKYRDQLLNMLVDPNEKAHFSFEVEMLDLFNACPQAAALLHEHPDWLFNSLDNALRECQERAGVSEGNEVRAVGGCGAAQLTRQWRRERPAAGAHVGRLPYDDALGMTEAALCFTCPSLGTSSGTVRIAPSAPPSPAQMGVKLLPKPNVHVRLCGYLPLGDWIKPNISSIRSADKGKLLQARGTVALRTC